MPTGKPTKSKPCAICGKMFLPEKPSSKICKDDHYVKCPICDEPMLWNTTRKVEPCSRECRKENRRRLNLEKYGVEHPMQSKEVQANHRKSMIEKYGVEHALQSSLIKAKAINTNREKFGTDWAMSNSEIKKKAEHTMMERYGAKTTLESEELKEKVKNTVIERYGSHNAMISKEIQNKAKATNLERYGTENPMQNVEIAQRSVDRRVEKYGSYMSEEILAKCRDRWRASLGVDNPSKSPQVIDKITATFLERYGVKRAIHVPEFRQKMIDTMISRYGQPYYYMTEQFKSSDHYRISIVNKNFANKLEANNIECELEFPIDRKSYDLRVGNTLIEINPTYTHNAVGNHWNKDGLPEDYHLNKSNVALENGYRCIHIFDWDDIDKIVDMLKPKKRVYARNCSIYKLNSDVGDTFLQENHLQGTCRGQLLYLGLVHEGELLQVMTFGKSRYDKKYDVELLRLCTKNGYTIVGGASKLFKFATQDYGLSNIISYCDLSKFSGDVYQKLGMKLVRKTPPQEIWSRGDEKITANLLRQRGFDQLFKTNFGKGTNNEQLMLEHGWLPVFDCGQAVFEYK